MKVLLGELTELTDWYNLGVQLGVSISSLKEIERQFAQYHGVLRCKTELFDRWLRNDANASWEKLAECLEMMGEGVRALAIRKRYCPETIKPEGGTCLCT